MASAAFAKVYGAVKSASKVPAGDLRRSEANARANVAQQRAQSASARQQKVYESLTLLIPDDPSIFLSLGLAAQSANDIQSAIAAYEQFLQLAANDPSAAQVKQRAEFLKQQLKANPLLQQSG